MTSASTVTVSVIDNPRIYHGFWQSYGSTFPQGEVLTVNTGVFTVLTSAIALYTAWVISRAARILDVIIFKSIYEKTKTSMEQSQCAALVANSKTPIGALTTATHLVRRGGPKGTLAAIIFTSIGVLSLQSAIPIFVALFPTRREGLIAVTNCGYQPEMISSDPLRYLVKLGRFSNAALMSTQPRPLRNAAPLPSLPTPTLSYVSQCPHGAICHPDHPFTFSSVYTLTSQHMRLNIQVPFSLRVADTCYRPIDARSLYHNDTASGSVRIALYYGPIRHSTGTNSFTDLVFEEQKYAPGYAMKSFSALTNNTLYDSNYWTPNSTLVLGGDTTLIFYYIGWVFRTQPSNDPIFATNQSLDDTSLGRLYESRDFVSPIVCDTKYQLCVDNGHDCSPVGSMAQVWNWMNDTKGGDVWDDIAIFFYASTTTPPIHRASYGSDAIASAQTLLGTSVQNDWENNTAARELGRLSQAGMTMLASGTQLAALGYWDQGRGSAVTPPHRLCDNVVIEAQSSVSILLTPYWVFLSITAVIVVISYADHLGAKKLSRWRVYGDPWTLYSVGQLHRQVAEHRYGRLNSARASKRWPNLTSARSGLEIVEKYGSMYLAPATPTSILSYEWTDLAISEIATPVSPTSLPQEPFTRLVSPDTLMSPLSPPGISTSRHVVNAPLSTASPASYTNSETTSLQPSCNISPPEASQVPPASSRQITERMASAVSTPQEPDSSRALQDPDLSFHGDVYNPYDSRHD